MKETCPTCGNPMVPGDRFCGSCGADVTAVGNALTKVLPPLDAPPPPVTVDVGAGPEPQPPRRSKGVVITAVGLVVVAVLALGGVVMLAGGGDDADGRASDSTSVSASPATTAADAGAAVAATTAAPTTSLPTTVAPTTVVIPTLSVTPPPPVAPGETVYVNVAVDRPEAVASLQLLVDGRQVDQRPVGGALEWKSANVEGSYSASVIARGPNGAEVASEPLQLLVQLPATTTTVPLMPTDVLVALDRAERLADAYAAHDWDAARQLNPDRAKITDAKMNTGWGHLVRSSVYLYSWTPVGAGFDLYIGNVAEEDCSLVPGACTGSITQGRRTQTFCLRWTYSNGTVKERGLVDKDRKQLQTPGWPLDDAERRALSDRHCGWLAGIGSG